MASATAIYVTEREAIAVRVEGSAKRPRLTRAGRVAFERPEPGEDGLPPTADEVHDSIVIQLKAWLRHSKLGGGNLILCADSGSVILRDLKVSFTERRQIDKVIAFQVEGVIPSIDIEDLAVAYTVLEKEADGSRLLVAAAHRDPLREAIDWLDEAGVSPVMADSTIGGAMNLRAITPELANTTKPTLWVDLQGDWALIAVLDGATILGMRMLRVPAAATAELQAAVEAAASPLDDSDSEDATLVVMDEGEGDEAESAGWPDEKPTVAPASAPTSQASQEEIEDAAAKAAALVKMLVTEARRSILSAQAAGAIQSVVLSGVPSGLAPIASLIQMELGIQSVTVMDLLEPMVPKTRKGDLKVDLPPSLMVPVLAGVAIKGIGGDASGMDFLVGDLSAGDAFEQSKSALAIGVTVLFLVCGVLLMLVVREQQRIDQEAQRRMTEANISVLHRQAYAAAPESRRAQFPETDDLMAQSIAVRNRLQDEINNIKAGNKRNFPPLYEADRAFQEVLIKVLEVLGEPMRGGGSNTVHFFLQKFEFTQNPANAIGRDSSGQLVIEAFVEVNPRAMRFDLREALEKLMIPNPNWDGRDEATRLVPLFAPDGIKAEPGAATIDRGERKVENRTEKIQIQFVRFICTLRPLTYGSTGAGDAPRTPGGLRPRGG